MVTLNTAAALAALKDDACPATAVYLACQGLLFDNTWLAWEPESIWLDLHRTHQIDVSLLNRNKILAIRSLHTTSTFWTDALVFEKTCMVLNFEEPNIGAIDDCPVPFICWGVKEIEAYTASSEEFAAVSFDREPFEYMVVQLYRENFLVAPEQLKQVQVRLDRRYPPETKELRKEVEKEWNAALKKGSLLSATFPETAVGVQLARLAAVSTYVDKRTDELRGAITRLRT